MCSVLAWKGCIDEQSEHGTDAVCIRNSRLTVHPIINATMVLYSRKDGIDDRGGLESIGTNYGTQILQLDLANGSELS